jgi:hypothetical protein
LCKIGAASQSWPAISGTLVLLQSLMLAFSLANCFRTMASMDCSHLG